MLEEIRARIDTISKSVGREDYPVTRDEAQVRSALLTAMMARDMCEELADNPLLPDAMCSCAEYIIEVLRG